MVTDESRSSAGRSSSTPRAGPLRDRPREPSDQLEIAILGAGFAGLGMAAHLLARGRDGFLIFEADEGVGGTWRANVYPGCACDVPSHLYSYSFAPSPDWSHAYARQPEILAYLERFADQRGLRPFLRLGERIETATWDEASGLWHLRSAAGRRWSARHLVAGTGPLRIPKMPDIPGLDRFEGEVMHTARWRQEIDLRGRRVAVIGTGASAIQVIPALAEIAGEVTVFQRTPPWILPRNDRPIPERRKRWFRRFPLLGKLLRLRIYLTHELLGTPLFAIPGLGALAERRARRHLARQVTDPRLRSLLTPGYRIGCKRVLLSDDYYPALQRPHVDLVPSAVERVTPRSVVATDGTEREVDAIVLATGFEVTRFLAPLEVRGTDGVRLEQAWAEGAAALLGITVPQFPNLYLLLGPNTGLGHNSVVIMIEAQIHYVLRLLDLARARGADAVEPSTGALDRFREEMRRRLSRAVWSAGGCSSWYLDAEGRNVTLWPGYTTEYWLRTRRPEPAAFRFLKSRGR